MKGLTAAWLTYIGIATYQWEKSNRGTLPPPSIYLGSSVIFAGLGLVGTAAPGFAATFAWALIVAAGVSGAFDQIGDTPTPAKAGASPSAAAANAGTQGNIDHGGGGARRKAKSGPAPKGRKPVVAPKPPATSPGPPFVFPN